MTPTLRIHLFQARGLGRDSQDLTLSSSWPCFFPHPSVCLSPPPPDSSITHVHTHAQMHTETHSCTLSQWEPLLCVGWTCPGAEPAGPVAPAASQTLSCTHLPRSSCDKTTSPRSWEQTCPAPRKTPRQPPSISDKEACAPICNV